MTDDIIWVPNRAARRDAPWTAAQDAILSDRGQAAAAETIGGWPGHAPTPLHALPGAAAEFGVAEVLYKDEAPRFGLGSFKALGGAYAVARLLRAELSRRLGREVSMAEVTARAHPEAGEVTVCCATDGNHGRSVAWGAQRFGAGCVIFIHAGVSDSRRDAIAAYGAEVRRTAGNYDDSVREAQRMAAGNGWFVVSDTSYPGYVDVPRDVMQGYEIMAAEAFDAAPAAPTHIFLQTGVGGMAAAVAAAAKRRWGAARPCIVLADPVRADCWVASFRADAPVAVEGDLDTMMAGLACGEVSVLAWEILHDHADGVIGIEESAVPRWMRRLAAGRDGAPAITAGESAVAGLAAAQIACGAPDLRAALGIDAGSRIMIFGSEGDTDPALYRSIIAGEEG